jgi:hypothetical protein
MTKHAVYYLTQTGQACLIAALMLIYLTVGAILTPTKPRHRTAAAARKARR